jgi:hypothetical protein
VKQQEQKITLLDALLSPRTNLSADACKFTRTVDKMSADEQEAINRAIELIR